MLLFIVLVSIFSVCFTDPGDGMQFGASLSLSENTLVVGCRPDVSATTGEQPFEYTYIFTYSNGAVNTNSFQRIANPNSPSPKNERLFGMGVAAIPVANTPSQVSTIAISDPFGCELADHTTCTSGVVYFYSSSNLGLSYSTNDNNVRIPFKTTVPTTAVSNNPIYASGPQNVGAMLVGGGKMGIVVASDGGRFYEPFSAYHGAVFVYSTQPRSSSPVMIYGEDFPSPVSPTETWVIGQALAISDNYFAATWLRMPDGGTKSPSADCVKIWKPTLDTNNNLILGTPSLVPDPDFKLETGMSRSDNGFGFSLSMTDDWLVVGAPHGKVQLSATDTPGKVFLFKNDHAGNWALQSSLTLNSPAVVKDLSGKALPNNPTLYGSTVSIATSSASNVVFVLAVGAPSAIMSDPTIEPTTGVVYIYTLLNNNQWKQFNGVIYQAITALGCNGDEYGNGPNLSLVNMGSKSVLAVGLPFSVNSDDGQVLLYETDSGDASVWKVQAPTLTINLPQLTSQPSPAPTSLPAVSSAGGASSTNTTVTAVVVTLVVLLAAGGGYWYYTRKQRAAATAAAAASSAGLDAKPVNKI